jgi:DNA replication protein DnaC
VPHLAFLDLVLSGPATTRRDNAIERRIRQAGFAERKTLEAFDWDFNAKVIDRAQFEELGTGDFIRRCDNLVLVGDSGVGKSHLIQAIGLQACVAGYRVIYRTSADLLTHLTASLADRTLPQELRRYASPDLLVIDEFGLDRIERTDCREAANLLYKVIESRGRERSTALVTNIDFECWGEYLGDAPLAMAFLDRLVDRAIIIKIAKGKSYRAHRAKRRDITAGTKEA